MQYQAGESGVAVLVREKSGSFLEEILKLGKQNVVRLAEGEKLSVVERSAGGEQLADNLIALQVGDDLVLIYADGTEVVIKDYFILCESAECSVVLPADTAEGVSLADVDDVPGQEMEDGSRLLYSHGDIGTLVAIAGENEALQQLILDGHENGLGGTENTGSEADSSSDYSLGSILAGIGLVAGGGAALASGGGSGGGASASNYVKGVVVLGPVVAGSRLLVELYEADGVTLIGSAEVDDNGEYSIDMNDYRGVVIGKLIDRNGDLADYWDEASRQSLDLDVNLFAVSDYQGGPLTMNLSPGSTIAATKHDISIAANQENTEKSGVTVGASKGLSNNDAAARERVATVNKNTGESLGAPGDITKETVNPSIAPGGAPATPNAAGAVMASLSGLSSKSSVSQAIADVAARLGDDGKPVDAGNADQLAKLMIENAPDDASRQLLSEYFGRLESAEGLVLNLDGTVLEDRILSREEASGADVTFTGTAPEGATGVELVIDGGSPITATLNADGTWQAVVTRAALAGAEDGAHALFVRATVPDESDSSQVLQSIVRYTSDAIDDKPVGLIFTEHKAIAENSDTSSALMVAKAVLVDLDGGDNGDYSYSLSGGADKDVFEIDATTGALVFKAGTTLDYETKSRYDVEVTASNSSETLKKSLTVSLQDVNEAPTTTAIDDQKAVKGIDYSFDAGAAFDDADAADKDNLSYKATGLPDGFVIDSKTGVISGQSDVNVDTVSVTVTATDTAGLSVQQSFDFRVVTAPRVASFAITDLVGDMNTGKQGNQLVFAVALSEKVEVSALSGATTVATATFKLGDELVKATYSGKDTGTADNTVLLFVASAPEGDASKATLTAITLEDGATITGVESTEPLVTTALGQTFEGYTLDNTLPEITATYEVAENTTADTTPKSLTLQANEAVTWNTTLGGSDASAFTLTDQGVLTFAAPTDHETKSSYSVDVTATDTAGNAHTQTVTVNVSDVNEAPEVVESDDHISNGTAKVTLVNGQQISGETFATDFVDPEGADLTFTYANVDADLGLTLAADGAISGTPTKDGTYTFTVTASDGEFQQNLNYEMTVVSAPVISRIEVLYGGSAVKPASQHDQLEFLVDLSEEVEFSDLLNTSTATFEFGIESVVATLKELKDVESPSGDKFTRLVFEGKAPAGDVSSVSLSAFTLNEGAALTGKESGALLVTTALGQTANFTLDNTAPIVAITSDAQNTLKAGEQAVVSFKFSEAVTGFDENDISVTGGSLTNLKQDAEDATLYTATFTPSPETNNGSASISITSGKFLDAAGNANDTAASLAQPIAFDTKTPAVTGINVDLASGDVSFQFDEAPAGFSLDDVTATGGELSDLQVNADDATKWTAKITPDDDFTGTVSVSVSDQYTDTAGNTGAANAGLPLAINDPGQAAPGYVNDSEKSAITVSGTSSPGATVELVIFNKNDQSLKTQKANVTAGEDGVWSKNNIDLTAISGLKDGVYVIQARAAHEGSITSGHIREFTLDTSVNEPTIEVPTLIEDSSFNAEDQLTVSVAADSDASEVKLTWSDSNGATADVIKSATFNASQQKWEAVFTKAELTSIQDGLVSLTAAVKDNAGNTASKTLSGANSGIQLELDNQKPLAVSSLDEQFFAVNKPVSVNVTGLFSDGDHASSSNATLTYKVTSGTLPSTLSLNAETGVISGTPTGVMTEAQTITVTATDGGGMSAEQPFDFQVVSPPVIQSLALQGGPKVMKSGSEAFFEVVFSEPVAFSESPRLLLDINGTEVITEMLPSGNGTNKLTFEVAAIPSGDGSAVSINEMQGVLYSVKTKIDADETVLGQGQQTTQLTVDDTGPAIANTSFNANENATGVGNVGATDANGLAQTNTYTLSGDDAALFNINAEGELSFKQAQNFESPADDNGDKVYSLNVEAKDQAGNTTNKAITVNLKNVNEAPTATADSVSETAITNQPFSLDMSSHFSDIDAGDSLTFSAENLPDGLSISKQGVISGSATTKADEASFTIKATDAGGLSVTKDIAITVLAAPVASSEVDGVTNLDVRSNIVLTFAEAVTANSGFNIVLTDTNENGIGWKNDQTVNTQTIAVDDTDRVTISGDGKTVTINPLFDLDLATNYTLSIGAGAFTGGTSNQGSLEVAMSFTTVTPATDDVGALSQILDAAGGLIDSNYWVDAHQSRPSAASIDVDASTKDIAVAVSIHSALTTSYVTNTEGHIKLLGETDLNDIIYNDHANTGLLEEGKLDENIGWVDAVKTVGSNGGTEGSMIIYDHNKDGTFGIYNDTKLMEAGAGTVIYG